MKAIFKLEKLSSMAFGRSDNDHANDSRCVEMAWKLTVTNNAPTELGGERKKRRRSKATANMRLKVQLRINNNHKSQSDGDQQQVKRERPWRKEHCFCGELALRGEMSFQFCFQAFLGLQTHQFNRLHGNCSLCYIYAFLFLFQLLHGSR